MGGRPAGRWATFATVIAFAVAASCTGEDAGGRPTASAGGQGSGGDPRRPVILDYSPTISDIGALAFLASHPDLRLIGVTLPGTGESHCEPGVRHTRGVLEALGLPDVPVACGPEAPITGWNAFPTSWRIASDEMFLPEAPPNEARPAPELISDLVRGASSPVHVVAVAPLTNLAVALTDDPGLADRLDGITIMGGAVDVPGNVFRNGVAEWNIWVDPTAAGIVLSSGAPVTLVPLDATNAVPTSRTFFEGLQASAGSPPADLVLGSWSARADWYENPEGFVYLWDELAAAVAADPSLVELQPARLVVDDDLRENKGWTRRDPSGSEVMVATSADRLGFEERFLEVLAGRPVALGYLEATPEELRYFEAVARVNVDASERADAILRRVAREMGIPQPPTEQETLTILGVALPQLFDQALAWQVRAIRRLDPPSRLGGPHRGLVQALDGFLVSRDEVIAAVAADPSFEAFEPFFQGVGAACDGLQAEVDLRLLALELACFG